MPRVKFKKHSQIRFLDDIRKNVGANTWVKFAEILEINKRSLLDWKRGKYTLPEEVFRKCVELTDEAKVKIPSYQILPDFWSTKKAAKKSWKTLTEKYGGIPLWICRKGGLTFAKKRRLYPDLYKHCSRGRRKEIFTPPETLELAEFIGIVLGDGGITDSQVIISLHKENDKNYVSFVFNLIEGLFKVRPSVYRYYTSSHENVITITVSRKNIVEFLLSKGLKKGSKVRQQAKVPYWIQKNLEFMKSCMRGLVDTDGCVYSHQHWSHGYRHFNIGLEFTNRSNPLLNFVYEVLTFLDFSPKFSRKGIILYRESEIFRYAQQIGFSNPYHADRLEIFSTIKYKGRGVANWQAATLEKL